MPIWTPSESCSGSFNQNMAIGSVNMIEAVKIPV